MVEPESRAPRSRSPAPSSSCWPPKRSPSAADRVGSARRRRPPRPARWPLPNSAARCSCSPSIRPSVWPTRSGSSSSATSSGVCPPSSSRRPVSTHVASSTRRCSTPRSRGTRSCARTRPTRRPATRSSPTRCTRTSPASSSRATTTSRWSGCTRSTCPGRYDLIIVDTPPTRNAIDFLEAPERMADFFSSRLLRWLITPYRSRFVNAASRPFYNVAGSHPRVAVPRGHRRVLHPVPDDVRRVRRAGPSGHPNARGSPHHLHRREHTRRSARARGRVLHQRAATNATSTSARSCSTRCCLRTSSTTTRAAVGRDAVPQGRADRRRDGRRSSLGERRSRGPGAPRGRRELPQLPRRRDA